jgi:alkanesulfonate monooxygenase SsuD/methylene tetrahydromethanopterin reductase-like flavin-dependent oxidoreductase (luciferase family)
VDNGRELTAFGEVVDPKMQAARLDEGAQLLVDLWGGQRVHHAGPHYVADDVRMRPVPVQQPRIPLWFAARGRALAPVRRAARYDGLFPIEMDLAAFQRAVDTVRAERGGLDGFDIAVRVEPDIDMPGFIAAGATWAMHALAPTVTVKEALALAGRPPGLD